MSDETNTYKYPIGIARIVLGAYMLWAFLDKTFGLGSIFIGTAEDAVKTNPRERKN